MNEYGCARGALGAAADELWTHAPLGASGVSWVLRN